MFSACGRTRNKEALYPWPLSEDQDAAGTVGRRPRISCADLAGAKEKALISAPPPPTPVATSG